MTYAQALAAIQHRVLKARRECWPSDHFLVVDLYLIPVLKTSQGVIEYWLTPEEEKATDWILLTP